MTGENYKPYPCIHTHWQVAQSRHTSQNLPKRMATPTHGRKGKHYLQHCISVMRAGSLKFSILASIKV